MNLKSIVSIILVLLSSLRLIPHIFCAKWSGNSKLIIADLERWSRQLLNEKPVTRYSKISAFIRLMTGYPEYRNLFYNRIGWVAIFLSPLCRPMPTLYIYTKDIGPGLFIQHGFSTIVGAKKIGRTCWINQQVTIGFKNPDEYPILGDNVMIFSGAKVIGNVKIGDNAVIGANAVVDKDVPANCTVVGVPAYIVRRNGRKTREPLAS
jgi:serine O-acetyltransferase